MTQPHKGQRFTHRDGQVCRWLPYAMDGVAGLQYGWFTDNPPNMRKCLREHGLQGPEDAEDEQP